MPVVSFSAFSNYYNLFSLFWPPALCEGFREFNREILSLLFFAVFMACLFLVSFCYVMYSVAVAREMKIMLYSACESSAE